MEIELCVECGKEPIFVKERELGKKCYDKWWYKNLKFKLRFCVVCNKEITGSGLRLYCTECKPRRKHNPSPKAHLLAVKIWEKRNPERRKCYNLVRYNLAMVNVLYECPCDNGKKHNHHFDYDKPFEVIRLCHKCHRLEHERLNAIKIKEVV